MKLNLCIGGILFFRSSRWLSKVRIYYCRVRWFNKSSEVSSFHSNPHRTMSCFFVKTCSTLDLTIENLTKAYSNTRFLLKSAPPWDFVGSNSCEPTVHQQKQLYWSKEWSSVEYFKQIQGKNLKNFIFKLYIQNENCD